MFSEGGFHIVGSLNFVKPKRRRVRIEPGSGPSMVEIAREGSRDYDRDYDKDGRLSKEHVLRVEADRAWRHVDHLRLLLLLESLVLLDSRAGDDFKPVHHAVDEGFPLLHAHLRDAGLHRGTDARLRSPIPMMRPL
jgi:hypothetical protein